MNECQRQASPHCHSFSKVVLIGSLLPIQDIFGIYACGFNCIGGESMPLSNMNILLAIIIRFEVWHIMNVITDFGKNAILSSVCACLISDILTEPTKIASSWGQHGAHLGPFGPRWALSWPYEPCYQGSRDFHKKAPVWKPLETLNKEVQEASKRANRRTPGDSFTNI